MLRPGDEWISPSRNPPLPLRTVAQMFWRPGILALGLTALVWWLVPSFPVTSACDRSPSAPLGNVYLFVLEPFGDDLDRAGDRALVALHDPAGVLTQGGSLDGVGEQVRDGAFQFTG